VFNFYIIVGNIVQSLDTNGHDFDVSLAFCPTPQLLTKLFLRNTLQHFFFLNDFGLPPYLGSKPERYPEIKLSFSNNDKNQQAAVKVIL
jgi:hypothetical protein